MSHLARILIIGDSISIGYTPFVAEMLAGSAETHHNPGNGGDSANVRANLDTWLAEQPADVIHLNCGLHDIKVARGGDARQVPLDAYRENLTWIVDRLRATGARLVWASSTPVVEAWHTARKGFDRYNADVDACNAVAAEIMTAAAVAVTDLHAAIQAAGREKTLSPDGVHFPDTVYRQLAERVAEGLRKAIGT